MKDVNKEYALDLTQNNKGEIAVYKRAFEFTFDENINLAIRHHQGELIKNTERRQMKFAAKHHRSELIETLLEVGYLIDQYFPSDKDFMNDQRVDIFIDCLLEDFSDLYLEDVYVAFKKNLKNIKMYGSPQVNELLKCLEMYRGQKNRLSFTERDNQHKRTKIGAPFQLTEPGVYKSYVEILKSFDSRKEDERIELEKKEAATKKAKEEAERYFDHFNDTKQG